MLSERKNLGRFRDGDRTVWADVYAQYLPEVAQVSRHGFLYTSGGEPRRFRGYRTVEAQENLIQETFSRAFSDESRRRYNGITPYGAYLKGICKNIVLDELRKNARHRTETDDVVLAAIASDEDIEAELIEDHAAKQIQGAVRELIDGLPLREKRFVELRFRDGLKQEAVAKKMKVGRSRVRTWEARIRNKMTAHLKRTGAWGEETQ